MSRSYAAHPTLRTAFVTDAVAAGRRRELAAALHGGLGPFGAQHLSPDAARPRRSQRCAQRTDRAFNVNLWVSTHDVPEEEYDGWDAAVARLRPLYDELGVAPPSDRGPPRTASTRSSRR